MTRAKAGRSRQRTVTLAELRQRLGRTAYAAGKWIERGMPVVERPRFRGDDYRLDETAAIRWLADEAERTAASRSASRSGAPSPADEEDPWRRDPMSYGLGLSHNLVLFTLPGLVAEEAVAVGVPMTAAQELADAVARGVSVNLRDMLGHHVDRFVSPEGVSRMYEGGCAAAVDWRALRLRAGEPEWEPPRPTPGFGQRVVDEEDDVTAEAEAAA